MLFNRVASLVIGQAGKQGVEITELRIAFSVKKGSTKTPNKCTVKVWNASPDTRSLMEVVGNVMILRAGYSQDLGAVVIFTGNVTRSLTMREGADWVTELEMEDGYLEFRDTKVSLSFAPGVTTAQILSDITRKFGLPVRPIPADIASLQYTNGFAFVGRLRDAMDKCCNYAGAEWSIQNREIQVIKKGGVLRKQAYLISPDTGLIGSPQQESRTMTEKAAADAGITASQPGVRRVRSKNKENEVQEMLRVDGFKVRSLLLPIVEPGGYVQLKSAGVPLSFFRVEEVSHEGDTHGSNWQTELTLRYTK